MKIGFTGTQQGMTDKQEARFNEYMQSFKNIEFHHGDCVGADAESHTIASRYTENIYIHPPWNSSKRAWCKSANMAEPKEYLDRNHDIVDATEILIATPKEADEQLRSGTWATIRYAKKQKKPFIIIRPDGSTATTI